MFEEMLADPEMRRIILRNFVSYFPIQGGVQACSSITSQNGGTANSVAKFTDTCNIENSAITESGGSVGVGASSPGGRFQVATANDTNPSNITAWDTRHSVVGGGGATSGAVGTSYDQTHNVGYIQTAIPNSAWGNLVLQSGGGSVAIGTTTPAAKLQVVTANDTDPTNITAWDSRHVAAGAGGGGGGGVGISYDQTHNVGYIQTAIPNSAWGNLALQSGGGSVVIGGTATKQSAHGPEKLSIQDSDELKVAAAAFVGSETNARLLIDMNGNHEWSNDGSDQTVVLGCTAIGHMNLVCFPLGSSAGGGLGIVAWKWSKLTSAVTSTQTTFTVDDPTQFATGERIRVENEICKITMIAGSVLTIDRGQEGTTAVAHAMGTPVVAIGTEEPQPRILFLNDGRGIAFSDGTNATDVSISRPAANQIFINGNFATGRANVTLAGGNNNDIGLLGATFVKVIGPSAAFAVTGFAGGSDGRILLLYNTTSQTMTIKNNNAGSAAANRILTLTGADVTLRTGGQSFATFIYDVDQGFWILAATN